MDLKLHLLETFPARGSDGHDYKVCAYERLRRDDTIQDADEHWLPTGVNEFRLDSGEQIDVHSDGTMTVLHTGVTLSKS